MERGEGRVARRRAATRQALVASAYELIGERGYHATTIGDITGRADVAVGSFYNYFDGKEAIFQAVVSDYVDPVGDRIDALGRTLPDARQRLAAGLHTVLAKGLSDPVWGRFLLQMAYVGGAVKLGLVPRMGRDLEAAWAAGLLPRPAQPMHVIPTLAGALLGALLALRDGVLGEPDVAPLMLSMLRIAGLADEDARQIIGSLAAPPDASASR